MRRKTCNWCMRLAFLMLVVALSVLRPQGLGEGRAGPGRDYVPPRVIQRFEPEYTNEALEARLEGSVTLSGLIGIDGILSNIRVVSGLGKGLDEKAVECFQKWRFSPAVRNGEPVPVHGQALITFRLPPNSR
jgi:TonB family protein